MVYIDQQESAILLFGPQALSFNRQFETLRRTLSSEVAGQDWILDTVAELPQYWDALTEVIPKIKGAVQGEKHLADLDSWFRRAPLEDDRLEQLPNLILTPLVVLTQLTQYWRYLELNQQSKEAGAKIDLQADLVARQKNGGVNEVQTLGFCTGLLSAFAVASANNQDEFEKYGAVAVRLAMLVGALVDAQEACNRELGHGQSKSYATAWRSAQQCQDMHQIIDSLFPQAYISVIYDEARVTVTTSQQTAPAFLQATRDYGITAAEVGLRGHFHSPSEDFLSLTNALIEYCDSIPDLRFPDASKLALPTYTNEAVDGKSIERSAGSLTKIALHAILVRQSNWYNTFAAVQANLGHDTIFVSFGPDRCVPPTLMRCLGPRLMQFADLDEEMPQRLASVLDPEAHSLHQQQSQQLHVDEDAIAVVGMSIKVAGADDVDEFSQMLRTGESQHEEITSERLMMDTLYREDDKDPKRKWYGNFIRDVDAFDHKFFKRSPRESSTMDPQQRLFLQASYQAVEQSGYFTETTSDSPTRNKKHVGVYLGACAGDYEHHAACHTANAFTATGNLKSFIPGKVSHYFGWTGPSMTFDTACSASTVAIHTACRNILSGECTAALAGGVSTITNFLWFQNLAGASFLSPTGQCKAFDEGADGYCRAEAIACVFLKKMSDAIADGNPILGCIPSTAVYQNQNCTPLFVPNSPSLSQLFTDVIKKAHVNPRDVSLVEAHGTGTPIGDPAEYESIRQALGGPIRSKPLVIGSVKGHIGHSEGASGAVSLIKIIMMMQECYIPRQASFSKMSHHIKTSPTDMMEVSTALRPWNDEYKIALINNYGASGSNASMIVTQSSQNSSGQASAFIRGDGVNKASFPFWITGFDTRSITAYCCKLMLFLKMREKAGLSLADVSFSVNRQSNRSLPHGLIFSCRSVSELEDKLSKPDNVIAPLKNERPVVLCFGGQVSTFIGLDRKLYDSVTLLRYHLDRCDTVMRSLGLSSLYPGIFLRSPITDAVKLQTMLFASQYACAKCWMDSGLAGKIVSVVGHSFGEITALCVSGTMSLRDTVKLVAGRAKLIRDGWGPDSGAMMAIEADVEDVHKILAEANRRYAGEYPASIACYNGPRSFTLAGPSEAIDLVAETIPQFGPLKSKRLNVTNAFHSTLVEPLVSRLEGIGRNLTFSNPVIPLERATENRQAAGSKITSAYVADHMRKPVYFNHAVRRISNDHPSAIWLEAGSASTITIMASRALAAGAKPDEHHFQALSLTNTDKGLEGLTDATLALWKQGLPVSFWAHHPLQTSEYATLLLPPYQFHKVQHWMELKSPAKAISEAATALTARAGPAFEQQQQSMDEKLLGLWSFIGYEEQNGKAKKPRFRVNTGSNKYKSYISGHLIAQTAPICPATLLVDMAIEALFSLHPQWATTAMQPVVLEMGNHSPLCVDPTRTVWLEFETLNDNNTLWGWKIFSTSNSGGSDVHVEAKLNIRSPDDVTYQNEFGRFERLVTHAQCTSILSMSDDEDVDILQGRNVYRAFAEVVEYGEIYRGVRRVVGRTGECAGRVRMKHSGETWLDVPLSDSFSQVGGLYINCMTDRPTNDMFIATGCEMSMRSPRIAKLGKEEFPETWHVLARHHRQAEKVYTSDVFVFNASNGMLTEVMIGITFARVAKASMSRMLTRLTTDESVLKVKPSQGQAIMATITTSTPSPIPQQPQSLDNVNNKEPAVQETANRKKSNKTKESTVRTSRPDITNDLRNLVANISGVEAHEIELDTEMADVGIDSLMGMEVARDVESTFKCTLDQTELMEATTLRKFVVCLNNALYGQGGGDTANEPVELDDEDDDDDSYSSQSQPEYNSDNTRSTSPGYPEVKPTFVEDPAKPVATAAAVPPAQTNLSISKLEILQSFGLVKMLTDQEIKRFNLDRIHKLVLAGSNRLSTALVVEQLEKLGCHLRSAEPGQVLDRVLFQPQHGRLIEFLYDFIEWGTRLVDIDMFSGQITRTNIPVPRKTSDVIFAELLQAFPEFTVANKLTYYAGKHLADVLTGTTDGIRVIFGTLEGRDLVQGLYLDHTFNRMQYGQMRDIVKRLMGNLPNNQGPFKILEMGAGTGGTTYVLAPMLASLGFPVEYTFTDLSPSMVANARRKFGKEYSFMRFVVHDIEKPPAEELHGQHLVVSSNAVHATHNLVTSLTNVRKALRHDGFLIILEMTESAPFIDLIFGLLEGWWLFDDGRKHAIVPAEHWERELHAAGFGHVDWTDGSLPENRYQKVMIALASGTQSERLPKPIPEDAPAHGIQDVAAREEEANNYLSKHINGFAAPAPLSLQERPSDALRDGQDAVVLITVRTVVCVNRKTSKPLNQRQAEAFSSRGISLSAGAQQKLRVLETDTSRPQLGLPVDEYNWLVRNVTHVVHNAWPMSGTRPIKAFEPQFQSLRNLLDLARDVADYRHNDAGIRIGFQLISSIGVVGEAGKARVLEDRVPFTATLPVGYCEAKWVCERMLDETLGKYPQRFRTMVVRPGQIAGSRTSGFWNPVEHFAFLVKSAQTLRAWPDFGGVLQWVPVDAAAGVMVDLCRVAELHNAPEPYPVYHIDNPVGQLWKEMNPVLADALGIPADRIMPFRDWVDMVRRSPLPAETINPAARLIDFLDDNFERMSCGGLILDTAKAKEHSRTMAELGPVHFDVARRYITSWKKMGYLYA
ncbi:Type I Iterative Polyketide synthase (PKS) [Pseudogymnoascus destructans]|uniref:Type I Iterative Polyketide synthase (PKS) n=1 Tax=Pseudogymnoascus destructans TaxID=655981 RepID=A0A176ZYE2_9PEZI|nr:Type I Iterative Polyketide synthase (PKS) [Pseudogymnoascus destructans]OAF54252.1 Type I Iterative Polyketide synthase (PKS) [Pseudogymnoascus destructans]